MDHILVCCGSEITRYKQTMAGNIGDIWAKTSYFWDETGTKKPALRGGIDLVTVTPQGGFCEAARCYSPLVTSPVPVTLLAGTALLTYSR